MTIETRAYTAEIKAANDGTFEAIMSAPTLDRDGEVVDALAFAPLPAKITVDIDHDMSVRSVVGSGQPFYDESGVLKIKGQFASTPLAQEVRTLVKEGHVDRMSVTFRAAQRGIGEDGIQHVTKGELLNVAFVVIPSNREAAVLAAKSGLLTTDEARELAGLDPLAADTATEELTGVDALRADVQRLAAELDEVKATVAGLVAKSFPEAPEAAPDEPTAEPAVDERAAARQRTAEKARAWLARTPSTPRTEGAITQ